MLVQKAVKVQIYPRESDKELLAKHFGVRRFIFNKFLEIRQKEYLENNPTIQINGVIFDSKRVLSIMPDDNYDELIIKFKKEFSKL